MPAPVTVELSEDDLERAEQYARDTVARYSTGDTMQALPWTGGELSDHDFREWVASRKQAGAAIDIETCEIGQWHAYDLDPYGMRYRFGELPDELQQVGRNEFVRSPTSNGWISTDDLSAEKVKALYARIERNRKQ